MSGRRPLIRAFAAAIACGLGFAAASTPVFAADAPANVENSVVKVFSTMLYPDAARPWARQAPTDATGSGVVIEGNRILTNAHVVLYATQIQVQANQEGDKVPATVEAVAPGIDLAVLKLDDESFFKTHTPLSRAGKLTDVKDAVLVYGFPTGGNSLSITKGIVSRIEFVGYNYTTAGLRIQIDAAINPGNSGGPAVVGDQMIGLAFSNLSNAQNIGYIIPNEEITLFLQDVADGHYDGKPALYSELQTLENPGLRSYLKLDDSMHGIIVHQPYAPAGGASPLKEWDVITHIGDTPVDDQGMVRLDGNLRVRFPYLLSRTVKEGKVPLTIVRGGKSMKVSVPVYNDRPVLVPDLKGAYPPYFIYGPIVFSKATAQFVAGFAKNADAMNALSGIGSPLLTERSLPPTAERQELVIVSSPFFPHKLAKGFSNPFASVVYSVNGTRVRDLKHLVSLLRDLKDEYLVIETERLGGETLVFPRQEMTAATDAILNDNGVRAQGSSDMMEIWQGKGGSVAATKH